MKVLTSEQNRELDQQENEKLFHKEVLILRNDFYYKFYEHNHTNWFFDISYKPKQFPSGDAYAIRRIGEDQVFFFLGDAMGKGLNASVTSMLAAAFVNYYIDTALENESFDLLASTKAFQNYVNPLLFDEEVLSMMFLLIDFKEEVIYSAMFGMPPVLLCFKSGEVVKIRSNHTPLTKESKRVAIQKQSIKDIVKILFYTDGLNETKVTDTELYHRYLLEDFKHAPNYKHFLQKVYSRIDAFDDDMTFIFLEKEFCNRCTVAYYTIESRAHDVDAVINEAERFLKKNGMNPKDTAYTLQAFSEIVINAYEHGNLDIDSQTKQRLMENGTFDAFVKEREILYGDRKIEIMIHLKEEAGVKTFKIDVKDEGKGFDTSLMRNRIIKKSHFNGRGLLMVSQSVDAYYYNDKANRVIIKKFVPKELADEDQQSHQR
jgi:anti-sigma regulatory factor (Ser/Thr protein kinase)